MHIYISDILLKTIWATCHSQNVSVYVQSLLRNRSQKLANSAKYRKLQANTTFKVIQGQRF